MDVINDSMALSKFEEMTNKVKYQDYIMPWGKHQGKFIADIYVKYPEYFNWLQEKVTDPELRKALEVQVSIQERS